MYKEEKKKTTTLSLPLIGLVYIFFSSSFGCQCAMCAMCIERVSSKRNVYLFIGVDWLCWSSMRKWSQQMCKNPKRINTKKISQHVGINSQNCCHFSQSMPIPYIIISPPHRPDPFYIKLYVWIFPFWLLYYYHMIECHAILPAFWFWFQLSILFTHMFSATHNTQQNTTQPNPIQSKI